MEKQRKSNYELMKITSMIFIVIYHIIIHCNFIDNSQGTVRALLMLLKSIILIHVNSFIIVTGYFQCKSNIRISKIFSLNNAVWFYSIAWFLVFGFLKNNTGLELIGDNSTQVIIQTFIPLDFDGYWFINCYLLIYILSPILNKIINSCDKKQLKNVIIVLIILFSIIPCITAEKTFYVTLGRSLYCFVLLYFIGAYIRNYPIDKSIYFKNFSKNAKRLIFFCLFLGLGFIGFCLNYLSRDFYSSGSIMKYISGVFNDLSESYASPVLILQTVFYFLFFSTFEFKSKIINFISKYNFGVYLFSENIFVFLNFYRLTGFDGLVNIGSRLVIYIILLSFVMYAVSIVVEIIRKSIFSFISKLKISVKFRKCYRGYVESLGIKLNW